MDGGHTIGKDTGICGYSGGHKFWYYHLFLGVLSTVWKFQEFSATQILREINFGYLKPQKTTILTILAALNLDIL